MATPFHNTVSLRGIKDPKANRTFKISGTVTRADEGKAVSLDTASANTVKLAGDGDTIIGRLEIYEDRGLATIALGLLSDTFPIKAGQTVVVGDTVVGAGAGEVKAAATPAHAQNFVVEVSGGKATVCKF